MLIYVNEINNRIVFKIKSGYKYAQNFNSIYGKKLTDTAIKTGKDFATNAGKKIVHKSAEATGDFSGNKIADKITSMGRFKELRSKELGSAVGPPVKPRSKKEKDETNIMDKKHKKFIFLQKRESK